MKYKNIIDMHTHTDNSFDGNHSTMYMCENACAKGLRAIAFTDHIEVDFYREKNFDKTAVQSFFDVTKARSAFNGKLVVCAGIELGQPTYDTETAQEIISERDYDFVIGSIHNLRGEEDFWYLDYSKYDIDKLLSEYFDELCTLAAWGKFDTMAHVTYPLRYIVGEHGIPVDMAKYQPKVDEALRLLVENDRALEINTSGLRQKIGRTMPDEDVVKRFKELGGKMITIGSDAHYAEHLGAGIETGMDIAKRCGFNSVTLFQKRNPIEIPIE